jgi:hypothetical protein
VNVVVTQKLLMKVQELSKEELVKRIMNIRTRSKQLMLRKEKADKLAAKIVTTLITHRARNLRLNKSACSTTL